MNSAFFAKCIGLLGAVAATTLVGCASKTQFGAYCYYENYGALLVSWTQDSTLFTDLTINCGEGAHSLRNIWLDNVLHVSSSKFVNTSGFSKIGANLWRKYMEGGFMEIYEHEGDVLKVTVNIAFGERLPVCRISFDSDDQITVPVKKSQLYTLLGVPTKTGIMDGFN